MEMKYERVVSSALLAIHLLFTNLQSDQHDAMNDLSAGLLKEAKFWKLAKHKSVMVNMYFDCMIFCFAWLTISFRENMLIPGQHLRANE